MGWLARKYGLQTNSVTAIELVTADGQFRRVTSKNEPDLFWALRGGGGNFGIVTAIEFAVYPVEELYAGAMFFPFERAAEVLHTWRELLPTFPEELMTWANILHFPPLPEVPEPFRGASYAIVMGAYLGEEREGRELLQRVRDLGPEIDTFAMVPPIELGELAMDPPDPLPFVSGHELVSELSAELLDEFLEIVGPESGSGHDGDAVQPAPPGRCARAQVARRGRPRDTAGRGQHVRARGRPRRGDARGGARPGSTAWSRPPSRTAPASTRTSSRSPLTPARSSTQRRGTACAR